jgi:hypothetical protein
MRKPLLPLALLLGLLVAATHAVLAAQPSHTEAGQTAVASYDAFVQGATPQRGLFTLWHKNGDVYIELKAAQLNRDFVQTIVPASGLGRSLVWGNTDHLPTELVRFEPAGGDRVAIIWPSPAFIAPGDAAATRAIDASFARSIVGLAPIVARDEKTGTLVVDAKPFLDDQLDLKHILSESLGGADPYTLDTDRTYFGETKSFPENVVLSVEQGWSSPTQRLDDAPPDARHLQIRVVYNIAEPPGDADYRPRLADDRIGIYQDVYLQFADDHVLSRKLHYLVRWNMQPSDPSKPLSPAKHPMVFYLSNTIPERYRPAIRSAVLQWNAAFEKLGISDALQVRDQPNDPAWDPDDIRYNVLRWVTEYRPSFGADSQTLYDPRTGQEFRTGILISADIPVNALRDWTYVVDPARYGRTTDPMPPAFLEDSWKGVILHETGHNLGMQHNFIGKLAYTAAQLQDEHFTAEHGLTSTVMEYAPTNVWARPAGQGSYKQAVLGPYDYFVTHWAYAAIPNAPTPEAELPTLLEWASTWSDPLHRYASDEDVAWGNGHAADPRVSTGTLTNDPLGWCQGQLALYRTLVAHLDERFPQPGDAFESETDAFSYIFNRAKTCELLPTHFIGGQYLSRAHSGDPGAAPPVVPVPRAEQRRAFEMLSAGIFSASAWNVPAALLQHLGSSEWAGYGYVELPTYGNLPAWAYQPRDRHDIALSELVTGVQRSALAQIFQPLVLARLADGPAESTAPNPMRLADLFDWMRPAIFGELVGAKTRTIAAQRRGLQQLYTETLTGLVQTPAPGMPADARALAGLALRDLATDAARAGASAALDSVTRAHLERLAAEARAALEPPSGRPASLPDGRRT